MTTVLLSFFIMPIAATTVASNLPPAAAKAEAPAAKKSASAKSSKGTAGKKTNLSSVAAKELGLLKKLDSTFQAKAMSMKVDKTTKIPILEQERKASGKLFISNGRLRMELEGAEKSLLVVNKKNLWAVTYPGAEFKDAPVQVIKGNTTSKKGRNQNFISLLTQGGFLKFFSATGAQAQPGGDVLFFLSPKQEQTDFKRAQVRVSSDGQKILALNYWDDRDNETRLEFTDVQFESKLEDKLFQYSPPANADIMTL